MPALARGGEPVALTYRRDAPSAKAPRRHSACCRRSRPGTSPISCANAPAPANAKPGQIAYKTGTSYGFRDAWAVGYDGRHTIAVWVGRPDGAATPGLAGRAAAAPLLFDAFARLSTRRAPLPSAPDRRSASPPAATCRRRSSASATAATTTARPGAILEPRGADRVPARPVRDRGRRWRSGSVVVKAEGGALPLTWLVDGVPIESDPAPARGRIAGAGLGFHKLSVIDAKGRADRVTIRLK